MSKNNMFGFNFFQSTGLTLVGDPISLSTSNNMLARSRQISAIWGNIGTPTTSQNETGFDGDANKAYTFGDNDGAALEGKSQARPVADNTSMYTVSAYFKKTSSATTFPGFGMVYVNGSGIAAYATVDTDNGTLTTRTGGFAPDYSGVIDDGTFWRVWLSLANDGTGNNSLQVEVYACVEDSSIDGTWLVAETGTCVIDAICLESGVAAKNGVPGQFIETGPAANLNFSITLNDHPFVGAENHGLSNGDKVQFSGLLQMVELEGEVRTISEVQTHYFEISDTSTYSAGELSGAGQIQKVI